MTAHTLILAGPTASGKTAAALAIAARWPTEIVSVDSALVYRGMDIGTAKPSAEEQAAVPHHLIDIRDPLNAYSAAEFVRDAAQCVADIHARGNLALLTGGTMLYVKAWLDGLDDMPAANPTVRDRLSLEAATTGWPAMHERLQAVDPDTAARLAPNDSQRIQRALEVFETSGTPLSVWQTRRTQSTDSTQAPIAQRTTPLLSLEPVDRRWLHHRIDQRFEQMLDGGFEAELQALRVRPDLHMDLPSMRCVGYRQGWALLDEGANLSDRGSDAYALWLARGSAATRQLAKRQLTWLRGMGNRDVIPADHPKALDQLLTTVSDRLERQPL